MLLNLLFTSLSQTLLAQTFEITVYLFNFVPVNNLSFGYWASDINIGDGTAISAEKMVMRRGNETVPDLGAGYCYGRDDTRLKKRIECIVYSRHREHRHLVRKGGIDLFGGQVTFFAFVEMVYYHQSLVCWF